MARKSALQGVREGGDNSRESLQLLRGQPEVTELDRGKCEIRQYHVLQEDGRVAWRPGMWCSKNRCMGSNSSPDDMLCVSAFNIFI